MVSDSDSELTAEELEQFEGQELADSYGTLGVLITADHGTDSSGKVRHKFLNPGGKIIYRDHGTVLQALEYGSPTAPEGVTSEFQDPSDAYDGDF